MLNQLRILSKKSKIRGDNAPGKISVFLSVCLDAYKLYTGAEFYPRFAL